MDDGNDSISTFFYIPSRILETDKAQVVDSAKTTELA
jgi:hypothetical protein